MLTIGRIAEPFSEGIMLFTLKLGVDFPRICT
jgi:hypothetical protein